MRENVLAMAALTALAMGLVLAFGKSAAAATGLCML